MARALAALVVAIILATVTAASIVPEASANFTFTERDLASEKTLWALYKRWCAHYRMTRDPGEKARRFSVFKKKARLVHDFNKGEAPYKLGLNHFSDMSSEEIQGAYATCAFDAAKPQGAFTHGAIAARNLPDEVDWRLMRYGGLTGAVTGVKNQNPCGSCWAFAAVAAVEGLYAIRNSELVSLSEQQVLDCTISLGDDDCEGGFVTNAFEYIEKGLTSEGYYPYEGVQRIYRHDDVPNIAVIKGYEMVPPYDATALKKAVAHQPVVVLIAGGGDYFDHYTGGVFLGSCGPNISHAMTVVGYSTTDDSKNYWLVKNSWGTNWGEGGYIRMSRDIGGKEGLCGILTTPIYPI